MKIISNVVAVRIHNKERIDNKTSNVDHEPDKEIDGDTCASVFPRMNAYFQVVNMYGYLIKPFMFLANMHFRIQ